MYLGRFQLGTWLDIYLQTADTSNVPAMPVGPPKLKIWRASDGTSVYTSTMPIVDKTYKIGLFCSRFLLGSGFAIGMHIAEMSYVVSGNPFIRLRSFEIMPAGDQKGQVLSMYYLHEPAADYVVYQLESGLLARGKNPRVK